MQAESSVSLRIGLRVDAFFVPIGFYPGAAQRAGGILPANNVGTHFFGADQWSQRAQNFDFFVADRIGMKIERGLHGHEAEKLHQVILHHVAQGTGSFVVSAATFHTERFGGGNLHVIDVTMIPERLPD